MLLIVSGCSIGITAFLGYQSGRVNLTNRIFNQLTSLRASKGYQIESYLRTLRSHTQALSADLTVIEALQQFDRAYQQLEQAPISPKAQQELRQYYSREFLPRLAKTEQGTPVLSAYLPPNPAAQYLQYHYIASNRNPVGQKHRLDTAPDGSEYSRLHSKYHPMFREIIEKFGYYDLFLINPSGKIVYTVYKETDFSSDLTQGAYSETNLARLVATVRQAKQKNYAHIIDFAAYAPSYGAAAAFIAVPIFKTTQHSSDRDSGTSNNVNPEGSNQDISQLFAAEFLGVLAVQIPVNEINSVMTGNHNWQQDGLGKTGETYLVGADRLMRSQSRFLVEDSAGYLKKLQELGASPTTLKRIEAYKSTILEQRVDTRAVNAALYGKQGTEIIQDYRDVAVLSSYAPLRIEGLNWVILSEMDLTEAYEPISSFAYQVLISATLLMLLLTLLAMAIANWFIRPIQRLINYAATIESGEIDAVAEIHSRDEFGHLAQSFNAMVHSLRVQTQLVAQKSQENEQLLLSLFPDAIARRLKKGEKDIAEQIPNVVVVFAELTGFVQLTANLTTQESVTLLNELVEAFDNVGDRYGMEKIKTMGYSYLSVCGLSNAYLDHDKRAIDFALEMLTILRRAQVDHGLMLNVRIGINAGDVVAGIVGKHRFIYDVWGDTINIASTLRSACPAGAMLVAPAIYERLKDLYAFEPAELVELAHNQHLVAWRLKHPAAVG
ncbi:adenylate/guanylate cyclase domain-containing protein [Alkalinema sp. FACHB-956]|uniref:adenylate/guanylate cyclase domain-containing protein n=1 Tax=Alkalinema sp. FACHB-956 TaxID=2692768 RepID=UPI001F557A8D|nr:adenylate/guanylate cyclase domain-containing protein [Alkalinema sp. FACHB-956]